MRYLLIILSLVLSFGVADAGTLTLSGSTCAGTVDTTSGAFTINCAPASTPPPVIPPPPLSNPFPVPAAVTATGLPIYHSTMPWSSTRLLSSGVGLTSNPGVWRVDFTTPASLSGTARLWGTDYQTGSIFLQSVLVRNSDGTVIESSGNATIFNIDFAIGPAPNSWTLGLAPSTSYSLYVWYQNSGGTGLMAELYP